MYVYLWWIYNSKTLFTFFGVLGVELYILPPLTTCCAKLFLYGAETRFCCLVVGYNISHAILLASFPALLGIGNWVEMSFSAFARTLWGLFCVFSAKFFRNKIVISFWIEHNGYHSGLDFHTQTILDTFFLGSLSKQNVNCNHDANELQSDVDERCHF